jgi:tRNA A37 methylthiotransferase MiaB
MKIFIKGLHSCVMRKQKVEQYKAFLLANGHSILTEPEGCDYVLIWTCAFRGDIRDFSLDIIDGFRASHPGKVIVAGCLPDIVSDVAKTRPDLIVVPWKEDEAIMQGLFGASPTLDSLLSIFSEERICEDAMQFRKEHADTDVTFHDQFIKLVVSEGCYFECAYCSEKLAFPPFRSMPFEGLVSSCREQMERTGVTDVILMADSLGQYGMDTGTDFPALIDAILALSPKVRIAFNNLNPANFVQYMEHFGRYIDAGRIKHLNLPIQSGSDHVLKRMNRPYTVADIDAMFSFLKSKNFTAFDTHLIMGFPGERDEDVEATVAFILKHRPQYVLLSKYMESLNAPSARLDGKVPAETAKRRIVDAERRFKAAGIICNSDESDLSKERLRKINLREERL